MNTIRIKSLGPLLKLAVFLTTLCALIHAQSGTEAPDPKPSATVEELLLQSDTLATSQHFAEAVSAADRALDLARQIGDKLGLAQAEMQRARDLHNLQRSADALNAWLLAAHSWEGAGQHPEEITALVQAGLLLMKDKKSDAETLFAKALSMGKAETQRPSAAAQSLQDSGTALYQNDQESAAWQFLTAALEIRERQTPDSLELARTLIAFAKIADDRGQEHSDTHDCTLAKDYSLRAALIAQKLAPNSPVLVQSFEILADSKGNLDMYDSAFQHYQEALKTQRIIAPGGSAEEAGILRSLGVMDSNFLSAREYLEQAVAMSEKQGPASKSLQLSLEALGNLEENEGNLASAREHLARVMEIEKALYGGVWASTLLNVGVIALDQFDLEASRDYLERGLARFLKTHPDNVGVEVALTNLSQLFYSQGDLKSALAYDRRALAFDKTHLGQDSMETADNLSVMGDILRDQGDFKAAANFYHRALSIRAKRAPDSEHVAESFASLSLLARRQGNRKLALEYDRHALVMGEKSCANSWCVVEILNDIGELAYSMGDFADAETYFRRAVDIRERSLGPNHPDLGRSLNGLGLVLAASGKQEEALEAALRAESIGTEHLRLAVRTLSERQALAYEDIRASGLDLAVTLAANRQSNAGVRAKVFDRLIRSRALVFDELAARRLSLFTSADPQINRLAEQLSSARRRLATLTFRGAGDNPPETYRKLLIDAQQEKEDAERKLAEASLAFRQDQSHPQLGLDDIASGLPVDSKLVSFVRYVRHDLRKDVSGKIIPHSSLSYGAFVLEAGKAEPAFVALAAANEIEPLVSTWRYEIERPAEAPDFATRSFEDKYRQIGVALRRKIWDPLTPFIAGTTQVFVVPDASLHLVNLLALPIGKDQYLVETGPSIHYLSTERDLRPVQSVRGKGILVVGNPAFESRQLASNRPKATNAGEATQFDVLRGSRSACRGFQNLRFAPLPSSDQEAKDVMALWQESVSKETQGQNFGAEEISLELRGAKATPEAFEQYVQGRRVVHLATHGFFLESGCRSALERQSQRAGPERSFLPAMGENPLLLSGLAFAGANQSRGHRNGIDGILTAEQIAGLNLEGVEWAILSACDTGVGAIKAGEGVFGLRRAFLAAGAKTVIMSLWRVEDESTRHWMSNLYRERFLNGRNTAESVRVATLRELQERRKKKRSTHPFYWAAFIAAGDWH